MSEELVQWDFGDLFSEKKTRKVFTVGELTSQIKQLLIRQFGTVWVSGEVSGFKLQSSGHIYFTLKDAQAQIPCVLFRGTRGIHREDIANGKKLLIQGEMGLYEPHGAYQLTVRAVEQAGAGELAAAFERLKQKLKEEGLFDPARKRPIPPTPRRIGIVTSPTGAALQDILNVFRSDYPGLSIILAPCKVQGDGAAEEIVRSIQRLNRYSANLEANVSNTASTPISQCPLEVILVTRGGGSQEDLWCFNEEIVARAIAASALPVISAVGHEIDFSISDFVADLRCATPTAAAKLISQSAHDALLDLQNYFIRLHNITRQTIQHDFDQVEMCRQHLAILSPLRQVEYLLQQLDNLNQDLCSAIQQHIQNQYISLTHSSERLKLLRPSDRITQLQDQLNELKHRLGKTPGRSLEDARSRIKYIAKSIELLNPIAILSRGYSITTDTQTGSIIKSATQLTPTTRLNTRFAHGQAQSIIETITPDPSLDQ